MAMTACYSNYADLAPTHVQQQHPQQQQQCFATNAATTVLQQQQQQMQQHPQQQTRIQPVQQKDYSIPLHVDCSVEYELPNQAKPPAGSRVEPLLMIHPCYFRKMESQRRSPFINNMPPVTNSSRSSSSSNAAAAAASSRRRAAAVQQQQLVAQQQQQQQQQLSHQQQLSQQLSQQQQQLAQQQQHHMYTQQQQQQHQASWEQQQHVVPAMPALVPIAAGAQAMSMYSKPVGKRDLMLSGGLSYTTDTSAVATASSIPGVHWDAERSPLAAIPRDYQQSGPEHAATVHHQHQHHHHHHHHPQHHPEKHQQQQQQQQHQQQQQQQLQQQQQQQQQHQNTILSGKYRQYLRAHRLHPYMERAAAFQPPPALQQVSCYNV
ncbi:centrosomal and chromosomal factor-like [Ctenocephalides felis]|uniref:centrosomal and chromosomal factor-like n=1 Tax=Ctenocephalides felis TaxID=7515 RepID=UPI000E6E1EEF|nr:centrosomal and chromosomal factor-like [Ctenocephalides felis]